MSEQQFVSALKRKHGLPGPAGLRISDDELRRSPSELPLRFAREKLFARPPHGTSWPNHVMHYTVETCLLAMYDAKIGNTVTSMMDGLPENAHMLHVWQCCGMQWWLKFNGVSIFPSASLVRSCTYTDVLDCVNGSDIHMSFPHILFGLPDEAAFKNADGSDRIRYVLTNFVDQDDELTAQFGNTTRTVEMPKTASKYILINAFWDSGFVSSFAMPLKDHVSIKDTINEFSKNIVEDEFRKMSLAEDELSREHEETTVLGQQITAMVLNFTLLMQSYPEYVSKKTATHDRQLATAKMTMPGTYVLNDRVKQIKPPVVVEQTEPVEDSTEVTMEQHARAAHWRRGHWRRQPHSTAWEVANSGVKVVLFKDGRRAHMTWIRPAYVGEIGGLHGKHE